MFQPGIEDRGRSESIKKLHTGSRAEPAINARATGGIDCAADHISTHTMPVFSALRGVGLAPRYEALVE